MNWKIQYLNWSWQNSYKYDHYAYCTHTHIQIERAKKNKTEKITITSHMKTLRSTKPVVTYLKRRTTTTTTFNRWLKFKVCNYDDNWLQNENENKAFDCLTAIWNMCHAPCLWLCLLSSLQLAYYIPFRANGFFPSYRWHAGTLVLLFLLLSFTCWLFFNCFSFIHCFIRFHLSDGSFWAFEGGPLWYIHIYIFLLM